MLIFVKLFGVVIVVMGIIFLINPNALKQYISFWKQKKRLQIGGVAAIIFGIIFLIAASQCRLAWLITVLGIWSIIKGMLLLTLGQKKIYAYLDRWLEKPISVTRPLFLIVLVIGALVIYSA